MVYQPKLYAQAGWLERERKKKLKVRGEKNIKKQSTPKNEVELFKLELNKILVFIVESVESNSFAISSKDPPYITGGSGI
ncbi:MAG: hypothetical protein A2452_00775 [Candidatus Firestonebacteria bacterium RIFOXYC2_FULL_39_67]|nr:MAG: hypothetical protein A2536_06325 [Candidatus Firestonebacteria bacterium RIFOXYD2_FULL_39_29]OGF56086.1 MAG: hypothetical protein A2452_00775 [Candidatus Firestonebacteria bacterium RIFOXYC2_FULL_39_67]OGF56467.1 MAG: hypothetical protein A2497_08270 [Candidatus Firestonebacteria bacterium RifOxyC12_full_39_7]